jgi:hypothetical protein
MPTELDVYAPERWVDDALFRPEVRVEITATARTVPRCRSHEDRPSI